jgi:hypothetical protein
MTELDTLANKINTKINSNKKCDLSQCNKCIAAKKIITKGAALHIVKSGKECYFHKEKINGEYKEFIYTRCLKSSNEGTENCNSHKSNNFKTFEFIKTNENSRLATPKDFDDIRDLNPISIITKNKKSKAYILLKKYAETLISDNLHNINFIDNKKASSKKSRDTSNLNDIIQPISLSSSITDNSTSKKYKEDEDNKSDCEASNNEASDHEDELEEEVAKDDELEEQDENDFVRIEMNNGNFYYIQNNDAYGENEDGTYSKVGVLTETKKKYHTFACDDKYYTIFFNHYHARKGDINICIVSNKIYDKKMNHIGNAIKKGSGTDYNLEFFNEI